MSYEVLNNTSIKMPRQQQRIGEIDILVDGASEREIIKREIAQAARDLMGDNAALKIQAFIEREAVKWRGYVAWAIANKDGGFEIHFDNDPFLRYALWLEEKD